MRELRVTLRLRSGHITPFQADTFFGHLCWAVAELDGEGAIRDLLARYADAPPLLVSDGFPRSGDAVFLPMPALPWPGFAATAKTLDIDREYLKKRRLLAGALKRVAKTPYVATDALLPLLASGMSGAALLKRIFDLTWCPKAMVPRESAECACVEWDACPALNPDNKETSACRRVRPPREMPAAVMHNAVNRLTAAAENLFQQEERYRDHDVAVFVSLDEARFSRERLTAGLDYLRANGYGKDRSTGKGAIDRYEIADHPFPIPPGANAFLSLSSAYAPRAGELAGTAWYQPYVKYGKLGGGFSTDANPFKKPVMMLRAGAVIAATPGGAYGGLIPAIHWERPEVVQYGYAYPLWMRLEADHA